MKNTNIQRLIWKEWREGWPVLAAFVVLPALVFPICRRFPDAYLSSAMVMALLFGIPFTAVLWASEKRRMVKGGRDIMDAVLPITPFEDWVASFILPALAVSTLGAWLYFLHSFTGIYFQRGDWREAIPACALAFMLCSFFSKTVSHFLGLILGTFLVLWAMFGAKSYHADSSSSMAICWHRMYVWLPLVVALAALAASEFRKAGPKRLKIFGAAILPLYILAMMYPLHGMVSENVRELTPWLGCCWRLVSPSANSQRFFIWAPGLPQAGSTTFRYGDRLDRKKIKGKWTVQNHYRNFKGYPALIAMNENGVAYMVDQQQNEPTASIIRWNLHTQKTDRIKLHDSDGFARRMRSWYRITLVQEFGYGGLAGWVDAKGERLLLVSVSELGTGYDLGMIDLRTGMCKLLLANTSFPSEKVVWTKDRAFLSGHGPFLQVDTANFRVIPSAGRSEKL